MEILNNLWSVMVTEDENLTKYVSLSLIFIEIYVVMKFFTTLLNINYTKRQRNIYYLIMFFITISNTIFMPKFLNIIIGFIAIPLSVKFIFKTSTIKSILSQIIPTLIIMVIETIYLKLILIIFGITTEQCSNTILYRLLFMIIIYTTIFFITKSIRIAKIKLNIYNELDFYHKKLLIINLIFVIISIGVEFYLMLFYNENLPLHITLISLLVIITYTSISIFSLVKAMNLEITKQNLEQAQLHNKTLELLYNNISAFKHDFSNIITALGGYISSKNIDGLENYYKKILDECNINNNLSILNPKIVNNAAIYNILSAKYYAANELNIDMNLQIFIDLNTLKIDTYEFCRILGILLDNAIEAASLCDEKKIIIDIHDYKKQRCQILTIENTYSNKNIDINKLSTKGYSTKTEDKESHGIGLWQVAKIIKKHNNLILETNKDDIFFKQELAIYY